MEKSRIYTEEAVLPIPVVAPRLLDEYNRYCRNELERRFLERLNDRAEKGNWCADCWSHLTDHVLISIYLPGDKARSLRVDFFGSRLLLGYDETHQFVTELNPDNPLVTVVPDGTPEQLAVIAADWLESELAEWIKRQPK